MTARDRGHVEEIINHLKRVESYYRINLTSEIEWLRGLTKEEPVSEELEEAAIQFATDTETGKVDVVKQGSFFCGAQWKEQQFEKNRLKHCDALTEEQAQMESDFVVQHLKKNNRTPTFTDAIEYGMRLKEKQMMAKAINTEASYTMSVPCICISLPLGVKVGDKVKVIVIKEY